MDSQKKKLLEDNYEKILNVGFCVIPYEDLSDIIAPNPMVFGTTKDEKIVSYEKVKELFKSQIEQMGDMVPAYERTRIASHISNEGNNAFIAEEITLTITSSEEVNNIFIRCSCVMEYIDSQWKLTHWHASTPVDTENDHWHMEEWKREKEKLQKLVDEQTADLKSKNRELEIEAAIERVRAVAMGMSKPEDMLKICRVISDQLEQFGVEHIRNLQTVIINEGKGTYHNYQYFTPYDKESTEITEYHKNPVVFEMANRLLESEDGFFAGRLTDEAFEEFRAYRKREHQFPDPLLDESKSLDYHFYSIGPGGLGITLYSPLHEDGLEIFKRFHNVFSLAYRRFRDIEKAEAQAREAEIELALERVRARTMAMQNSDELAEVSSLLFQQMKELGISTYGSGFTIWDEDRDKLISWVCNADGSLNPPFYLPMTEEPWHKEQYESWKKGEDFIVKDLEGEDWKAYLRYLRSFPLLDKAFATSEAAGHPMPVRQVHHAANFSHGNLLFITLEPRPEAHELFKRFAKVFEQTYTRFLDLKKAEEQAREAQIEAALERVRSRSMAMYKTEELKEVIQLVYNQFSVLKIPVEHAGFILDYKKRDDMHIWLADRQQGVPSEITIPYFDSPHWNSYLEAKSKGEHFFSNLLDFEEKNKFYKDLFELIPSMPEEVIESIFSKPGLAISTVLLDNVGLYIENYSGKPFTDEENSILRRIARVFEQTYTRFLDLKKAEAQAKESKIEAALERVRSRSLAMHHSSELSAVVDTLLQEFTQLEFTLTFCIINLIDGDDLSNTVWAANPETGKDAESYYMKFEDYPFHHAMWKAWKDQDKRFVYTLEGEEKKIYDEYLFKDTEFRRFPKHVKEANKALDRYVAGFTFFKYSGLQTVSVNEITEAELEILERFGRVFEQAYTRFLDLQKAEEQAREAQVEAALERVRSRSLAMHKTEELAVAIGLLQRELAQLEFALDNCIFWIIGKESHKATLWVAPVNDTNLPEPYHVPFTNLPYFNEVFQAWELRNPKWTYVLEGEDKKRVDEYLFNQTDFRNFPADVKNIFLQVKKTYVSISFYNYGGLHVSTDTPISESQREILSRFSKVFDQTYTRFLDLQKAEAQTREAQISLAVERVRAKALAMFKSEEILDVVYKLKEEIMGLNIPGVSAATIHLKETDGRYRAWDLTSIEGDENELQISLDISYNMDDTHPDFFMREVWARTEDYFVVIQDTDRTPHTVQWLQQNGYSKEAREFEEFLEASKLEQAYHPTVPLNNGRMSIDLLEPPEPEVESILKKMAGAFDLAYKRFEDLQKAEAQTREAQLELSLERIRAQVTAMQESSDLFDVVVSMRNEFLSLGHDADYFWHMRWLPESYEMSMTSEAGDRIGMVITIPGFVHEQIPGLAEWEKGDDPTYVLALDAEGAWEYIDNMNTHGRYEVADPNAPTREDIEQIGGLTFIMARTTHGEIGYSLQGMVPNPPKDAVDTLVRFAVVFDLAYKRFEDLKAAEHQALLIREERDRLEIALNELHATQDQLVQQEKLASLGQLTAGIAHEIKNPLNFVNNFSEVSIEMIEEAREEVREINSKFNTQNVELSHLLNDIEMNLKKIHEHGSRADSIVKSMLEHSRGGSGIKEPTDLNALVKEFTNLSFHGMRASKDPINVDMEFELEDSIGEVPLVAEDFSRVIVNLCNNAFDAMREKRNSEEGGVNTTEYKPKLIARTKLDGNRVQIEIHDNGPGVPEEIKDKILQPFFTTKKGTQGTGLGLSITNDIVKAHGGVLNVSTKAGVGTTFTIELPK